VPCAQAAAIFGGGELRGRTKLSTLPLRSWRRVRFRENPPVTDTEKSAQ
jgi:hypothetical protein